MPRVKTDKPICPRCGRPIDYFDRVKRGDRVYLYAVHYLGYEKVGNKIRKKVEKCYLGPVDSYKYVSLTHRDLGLTLRGAHDSLRAIDYLDALIRTLENPRLQLNPTVLRSIAHKLRILAERLEHIADLEESQS